MDEQRNAAQHHDNEFPAHSNNFIESKSVMSAFIKNLMKLLLHVFDKNKQVG